MSRAILLLSIVLPCAAQSLSDSARVIAADVAGALGPTDTVQVSARNLAGAPAADFDNAREAFEAAFRGRRSTLEPVAVTLTLADASGGAVWTAEVVRAGKREAVLVERAAAIAGAAAPLPVRIQKALLWEQSEPALDAALIDGGLVLLMPEAAAIVDLSAGARPRRVALGIDGPLPRDARGRISVEGGAVRFFVPGAACEGTLDPEFVVKCAEATTVWPGMPDNASLVAGRNYFSIEGLEPFFSAAAAGNGWVLAGIDGQARLYDASLQNGAVVGAAGSEIAPAATACGPVLLATSAGGERDTAQAFEIRDGKMTAVSDPLEFPGPVVALSSSAAVAREAQTGRYAVFSLAISCGR